MDPSLPAVEILAPSSAVAEPQAPQISLELYLGKKVALAASAIAAGVCDYTNAGRMTVATKQRVAGLFAELYTLRSIMLGDWDFDAICHEHGRKALAEACGGVNGATEQRIADELINTVVLVLRNVARSQTN